MSVEDAIVARAAGFGALTALIGAQPAMRLYPAIAAQNVATPYVVYQQISGVRMHAMGVDPGVANPRYQFTIAAKTNRETKLVGLQVIACFSRWRGTFAGVEVLDSFLDNEVSLPYDGETTLYQRTVDFLIWHRE